MEKTTAQLTFELIKSIQKDIKTFVNLEGKFIISKVTVGGMTYQVVFRGEDETLWLYANDIAVCDLTYLLDIK